MKKTDKEIDIWTDRLNEQFYKEIDIWTDRLTYVTVVAAGILILSMIFRAIF